MSQKERKIRIRPVHKKEIDLQRLARVIVELALERAEAEGVKTFTQPEIEEVRK